MSRSLDRGHDILPPAETPNPVTWHRKQRQGALSQTPMPVPRDSSLGPLLRPLCVQLVSGGFWLVSPRAGRQYYPRPVGVPTTGWFWTLRAAEAFEA